MIALTSILRRVPVTIFYGPHGAGKTTLIQQFLSEYQGGPLAFAVVQPTSFNFDAGLIRGLCLSLGRKEDAVYEIREDDSAVPWPGRMDEIIRECAAANKYDHLFIEVSGDCSITTAMDAAETIRNVVCVLDALELLQEVQGKVAEETFSSLGDWAPSIVLNKADLLTNEEVEKCLDYLQVLRPDAEIIACNFGEIAADFILGERVLPDVGETDDVVHPATTALFSARRPFHPQRFHDVCFGDWPGIWRAKGFFWLASRMGIVGGFSLTGTSCSSGPGGLWWAAVSRENWPQEPELQQKIKSGWREPFGDRRQELVIFGEKEAVPKILEKLNRCLLTDEEVEQGPVVWSQWPDPFPSWTEE